MSPVSSAKRRNYILTSRDTKKNLPSIPSPYLPLHPKRPPARRLPLLLLVLRPGPIQHLQEIRRPSSHPRMDVRLRRLDMVMEIVAEGLDMGEGIGAPLRGEMSWEEHKGHVADFVPGGVVGGRRGGVVEVRDVLEFEGRVVAEEDLRGVLDGAAAGVDEFLFRKTWLSFPLSLSLSVCVCGSRILGERGNYGPVRILCRRLGRFLRGISC